MKDNILKEIYTEENSSKWEQSSLPDFLAREYVVKEIKKLSNKNKVLLDLGCGTGRWTKRFSKNYKKTIGIDYSEEMIKLSKKNLRGNINYILGDMYNLHNLVGNEKFDVIVSLFSLQYSKNVNELSNLFKKVLLVLKRRGHFIFAVPHPYLILSNHSNWIKIKLLENFSQTKNPLYQAEIKLVGGDWKFTKDYFYSFEDYVNSLINSGYRINKIFEPLANQTLIMNYPDMKPDSIYPACLIIDAVKK